MDAKEKQVTIEISKPPGAVNHRSGCATQPGTGFFSRRWQVPTWQACQAQMA